MAKRFFYVSFGILCLVAAYQLGAERARADWDSSQQGGIVGGHGQDWYDAAGQAWHISLGSGFQRMPVNDLPMPVSSVRFMDDLELVTIDDEVFGGMVSLRQRKCRADGVGR